MPRGIGLGDHRAGFAEAKVQLAEEPLALAYAEREPEATREVCGERLAVPDRARESHGGRRLPQHGVDLHALSLREAGRSPRPVVLRQPLQAVRFEAVHPVLHGARGIAQHHRHLRTRHAVRNHQQPVEPVIIPRLGGTTEFVLETQDDGRVGQGEWSHNAR